MQSILRLIGPARPAPLAVTIGPTTFGDLYGDVLLIDQVAGLRPPARNLWQALPKLGAYLVAAREAGGQCAAYALYWPRPRAYVLARLVVARHARRRGVGRQLVRSFAERLNTRRSAVVLSLDEANLEAQLWARACGLRAEPALCDFDRGKYVFALRRTGGAPS